MKAVGQKYNKASAQIVLRYHIGKGVSVLPKSVHKEGEEQNIDVFDFNLSQEDLDIISTLDNGEVLFFSH